MPEHPPQGHREAMEELDLLRRVLDTVEGLQVVDAKGIITLVNESYLRIHNLTREQAEGHPVTDVIDNTRMHIVARTGVPELDEIQTIGGQEYVVSRIPIFKDGQCLGVVGRIVFQDIQKIQRLALKAKRLQVELEALRKSRGKAHADTRFSFEDVVATCEASLLAKERAMMGAPTGSTRDPAPEPVMKTRALSGDSASSGKRERLSSSSSSTFSAWRVWWRW